MAEWVLGGIGVRINEWIMYCRLVCNVATLIGARQGIAHGARAAAHEFVSAQDSCAVGAIDELFDALIVSVLSEDRRPDFEHGMALMFV